MEIKEFFLAHRFELLDYFENVKVSNQQTVIKFGGNNIDFGITFFIEGDLNENITTFEDKIEALFNTDNDLTILTQFARTIKKHEVIKEAPFLKISDDPLMHGFQLTFKEI
jgi:hypothetical protein